MNDINNSTLLEDDEPPPLPPPRGESLTRSINTDLPSEMLTENGIFIFLVLIHRSCYIYAKIFGF